MEGFELEALTRLPLAEAVLQLWGFVANPEDLQATFDRHRGRSYDKILKFSTMVHLIADALLEHQGSGHAAFQRAKDDGALPVSITAAYHKLRKLPIPLSCGFFQEGAGRLRELLPAGRDDAPESLQGLNRIVIDGKKIKFVEKRLGVTRGAQGAVLGGKTAVALSLDSGLAVAMSADPDGEVSDAPLMPDLLERLHEAVPGRCLLILDRQYCDLVQPDLIEAGGDHFLIRYNGKVKFHRDPERAPAEGRDEHGRAYTEEWGWIGAEKRLGRRYVRRITLSRPGDEDVSLITDLLDGAEYPAVDLLATYLRRWNIENVFQTITEVFHLKKLMSTSPEGTVFQFAFCLQLYNMIEVMRSYIAKGRDVAVESVSMEKLFGDVHRQLIAWEELVGASYTADHWSFSTSAAEVRGRLELLLGGLWFDRWKKAVSKGRRPVPRMEKFPGGHTSVHRLRLAAKGDRPPARPEGAETAANDL